MFKIESYITPILLSYVDKYVKDFKPADAQVSLWGGGVLLHNLVLKADVLQQEVALPFTLISGRIHELLIQVPWTKIMSEPIVVSIDTIECVLNLRPPAKSDDAPSPETPSRNTQVVEAPPGYMQALVRRIVSNIVLRVHHLIVKYVDDDIVLSLNVKHLEINSADANWQPAFADIDQTIPVLRRLIQLEDLTLCLDKADADGKIRFYQEPLLYRCQLTLRVLTRLMSANTRRPSSLSVQVRSSKLAWGVSSDQLSLLLRILSSRCDVNSSSPSPPANVPQATPLHTAATSVAESSQPETWSDWAWSWVPSLSDRDDAEEATLPPMPLPIQFIVCVDYVSFVFKLMELENSGKKRARSVLELSMKNAAIKGSVCAPTTLQVCLGTRSLLLEASGRLSSRLEPNTSSEEATTYLRSSLPEDPSWSWPEETFDQKVELAEAAEEEITITSVLNESPPSLHRHESPTDKLTRPIDSKLVTEHESLKFEEEFWQKMVPVLFVNFTHNRNPPVTDNAINPYDNPPKNFEYSDWEENVNIKVRIQPMELRVCMGLIHRIKAINSIFQDMPPTTIPEQPKRTLTVEENEALLNNLPQRHIDFEWRNFTIRILPWDQSPTEPSAPAQLALDVEIPKATVTCTGPLYPHRVCSAASQMPEDSGTLWQAARLHVTTAFSSVQAKLTSLGVDASPRPVARAEFKIISHKLLHPNFFVGRNSVLFSYLLQIKELNLCGSPARLQAAWEILNSLKIQNCSALLKHTSLPRDAITDEESVAVDMIVEDVNLRGYRTDKVNTHILHMQSMRATAFHKKDDSVKQAWLFSGPDAPVATPYLRVALQWCDEELKDSIDYLGVWSEKAAISIDPLLIAWLAYQPRIRAQEAMQPPLSGRCSSQYLRRRYTPPSSSGRGPSRSGSGGGAELVHSVRTRSHGSSSEPSERKEPDTPAFVPPPSKPWHDVDNLLILHGRLRRLLINMELGLILVYVTSSSASAVGCETVSEAMEQHAEANKQVLVSSLGRLSVHCNTGVHQLWQDVRTDGPTYISSLNLVIGESFPWKISLADMSCYTLEAARPLTVRFDTDSAGSGYTKRSAIVKTGKTRPETLLELVTTSVTLSVVTKTKEIKSHHKHEPSKKEHTIHTDERLKYFKSGVDFKPSTLKEFVRGPAKRRKSTDAENPEPVVPEPVPVKPPAGPVVSLGIHLHADTPPLIVRLDKEQVPIISAAIHCFKHIVGVITRPALRIPRRSSVTSSGSQRSLFRSVSEQDEQQSLSAESESRSELVSIFESPSTVDAEKVTAITPKTFFWFQWVVSRVTLVVKSATVKLAVDIDDIISSVDLQTHYNQAKIKFASASVRHYERGSRTDWKTGDLGGRVLEAREPSDAKEDNHFLAVTITQARISNLPASWKEELHPKLLQSKTTLDTMWEVYATLAPLEAVLQPVIVEHVMSILDEMTPQSSCCTQTQIERRSTPKFQWPFLYIVAGGLRLLVHTKKVDEDSKKDDTFMLLISKVEVNPHPENPICRRTVSALGLENGWMSSQGVFEGRQYDIYIQNVAIHSCQFIQVLNQEASEVTLNTQSENPALKWTQPPVSPVLTPVLHSLEVSVVLAPAHYSGSSLQCGPAVELNLLTDCSVELSIDQLALCDRLAMHFRKAIETTSKGSGQSQNVDICPYQEYLIYQPYTVVEDIATTPAARPDEALKTTSGMGADSGVETVTSYTNPISMKKSVSVAFAEEMTEPSEFLEVFVTMGVIELSLYTIDDSSPEVIALRPPRERKLDDEQPRVIQREDLEAPSPTQQQTQSPQPEEVKPPAANKQSRSDVHLNKGTTEMPTITPTARKAAGMLPLIHMTLHQPNVYYWKKKAQKSFQVSLFNAWIGLGASQSEKHWHQVLMSTGRGVADPVTEIPPALFTMKLLTIAPGGFSSGATLSQRGTLRLDVERPVQFRVSEDRLKRLKAIATLMKLCLQSPVPSKLYPEEDFKDNEVIETPALYKLRRYLVSHSIESVTIQTTQVCLTGEVGALGWESVSLQIATGGRPERLIARAFVCACLVSLGAPGDRRPLLHPMMFGMELEATWESWRRLESGVSAYEPTVRFLVELDIITVDLRPDDLRLINRLKKIVEDLSGKTDSVPPPPSNSTNTIFPSTSGPTPCMLSAGLEHCLSTANDTSDLSEHYYKDDLRSGAFKILSGAQHPMAYQVMLHDGAVSWRYPHPRAITRIVAFPLPGQDTEVDCVLEHFSQTLNRWEPYIYFQIPVGEPQEMKFFSLPPDSQFSVMWRFRTCDRNEEHPPFEFHSSHFLPRQDPLQTEQRPDPRRRSSRRANDVTAEQLSGVLRVDSYFAPRILPRLRVTVCLAAIDVHVHNAFPTVASNATSLEGYYVDKPLMKSHPVLTLVIRDAVAHAHLNCAAGVLMLLRARIQSEVLDCATGTMEQFVDEVRAQASLSLTSAVLQNVRLQFRTAPIRVALHVPRIRTLQSLVTEWSDATDLCRLDNSSSSYITVNTERIEMKSSGTVESASECTLRGRISLWVHNTCSLALRFGQENTEQIVPLGPRATRAYRWRCPVSSKNLRFALVGASADWEWSNSVPFTESSGKVRLQDTDDLCCANTPNATCSTGVVLHVRVTCRDAGRVMCLSGRLSLANMMCVNVLYKVRSRCPKSTSWRTVSSGELESESTGLTILCGEECELTLKIKLAEDGTGWSGDIPLKECPKENVPWLVKVPSVGEIPYVSMWCRVNRARSDGRILATIWPLYVLHSHLPLDTDVLISTDTGLSSPAVAAAEVRPPPFVQLAKGRGRSTQLMARGTTASRHSLTFQYRNIDCPVTQDAVPLHYGVTDVSVFEKRAAVYNIDEVTQQIEQWLLKPDSSATWPYSIVTRHFHRKWKPALLQPRCDVTVRYKAINAGGGCSLELQLSPVVLLCNASPIWLTLRSYDAAPLCKLESGEVISPPSTLLKKPFFMSVERGKETFVSRQLEVWLEEPGVYGAAPPGCVPLDHPTHIAINCHQEVALLTLYYEIINEINVFGIGSTYVFINKLDLDILISPIVVPETEAGDDIILQPKSFVFVSPLKEESLNGMPLCHFEVFGRWRGGDVTELRAHACIALAAGADPAHAPVPLRLGSGGPARRSVALIDAHKRSIPVVVTQQQHEGRWLVCVSRDPCAQFVVHNQTHMTLYIAQPTLPEESSEHTQTIPDCPGTHWYCQVEPNRIVHYSTPAHCARYPPSAPPPPHQNIPFIAIGRKPPHDESLDTEKANEESTPSWCTVVAVGGGEQLVQLPGGATVKLRTYQHAHCTLLHLQDQHQNDISASDIRKRLLGLSLTEESSETKNIDVADITSDTSILERVKAASNEEHTKDSEGSISITGQARSMRDLPSELTLASIQYCTPETSFVLNESDWKSSVDWTSVERVRGVCDGLVLELAVTGDVKPLLAVYLDRAAVRVVVDPKGTSTRLSVAELQVDNLQHESGQYDFAVVASTRSTRVEVEPWPTLWTMVAERYAFATKEEDAHVFVKTRHDQWTVVDETFNELTELEVRLGPLALYIEDAYVTDVISLLRSVVPPPEGGEYAHTLIEMRALQRPLRLRSLHVHPLHLTLTLHTAVRMYIALDQSPLRLSAFKLQDMMTSTERLTHALTVHYLSAAILGAGWVVGGLELLGAPGALASRVGNASGGVRGVASAAAAALLHSLSAWAGSLARNLDLLAGDEEHIRRAAAARRRPPDSLLSGLAAGITNFAINILGAVGGLAHHPLVGVVVGETDSSAAALRRGLLGALTKPLSATADLVAYAGTGLLRQTGWDPAPQPRGSSSARAQVGGWRRDRVRWAFRMNELDALFGFEAKLGLTPVLLLLTNKFLVIADPVTERILEMIDFRYCTLGPYQGPVIELNVAQSRQTRTEPKPTADDDEDDHQLNAAAMARVARYTGAGAGTGLAGYDTRVLALHSAAAQAHALHAALAALLHQDVACL